MTPKTSVSECFAFLQMRLRAGVRASSVWNPGRTDALRANSWSRAGGGAADGGSSLEQGAIPAKSALQSRCGDGLESPPFSRNAASRSQARKTCRRRPAFRINDILAALAQFLR